MKRLEFAKTFALLLVLLASHSRHSAHSEIIDAEETDRFCYPESSRNSRRSCECSNGSASPWGNRALRIDCSYKEFRAGDLSLVLPLYIDTLDLSWNSVDAVPVLISDSLRQLNLRHNNVSQLVAGNFRNLTSLKELYLGWNSIGQLEAGSFERLPHLQVLDLAHNNLHSLPGKLFAPLLVLSTLDLSWNRRLNESGVDLYTGLGLNWKLATLRLDACGLSELRLPVNAPLRELSLRRNQLQRIPGQLPESLLRLDVSDNPLEELLPEDTANLTQVRQLFLEDMPLLQGVASRALAAADLLETLSFQNSRQLRHFDAEAFGAPVDSRSSHHHKALRSVSFRGTLLRTFNSTLAPLFAQLAELDLNGLPLQCDCELVWLKQLPVQTNGRCYKPSRIRGMLVTSARGDAFSCDSWPRWAYSLVVLSLIALSAAGIYLIVMGLRPHRGVTMRRKVGAGSPYARVTIEPNRQENPPLGAEWPVSLPTT
ncbi:leucine-rich repeat neuronal protein 2 [Drosophila ficusphila]|uniref:leucine-rich repeat neuronal protein 2 n=1 Tax=Drosophila ficusphila TaxID=30025 RepID=UPI001C8A19B4|nr:leucine-rich repeat neuronal protein 2 [Drosophila ficusphila]